MNESKHTPLPWRSGPGGSQMAKYSQPFGIGNHDLKQLVCGCFGDVSGGHEQAEANAELICRAVNSHADLLALLETSKALAEKLGAVLFSLGSAGFVNPCFEDLDQKLAKLRADIAKAEGGQQ